MPAKAHARYGGSNAQRNKNCTAAAEYEAQYPNTSSVYATEGNALHDAMEYLLDCDEYRDPASVVGLAFWGVTITEDHLHDAVIPGLAYFDEHIGGAPYEIEVHADFPDLDDAGGTTDVVAFPQDRPDTMIMLDWKFGMGKAVSAIENDQMMFYSICILEKYALWDTIKKVELHLCQPRIYNNSSWTVSVEQLRIYKKEFIEAVTGPKFLRAGDWCTFCNHAANCTEKRAIARLALAWQPVADEIPGALDMVDDLRTWCNAVEKTAHQALSAGSHIERYKLVPKRATRKWAVDGTEVRSYLLGTGLELDTVAPRGLLSPAQAEKALKAAKKKTTIEAHMVKSESSGTTVAPESDKREGIQSTSASMAELGALLKTGAK